MFSSPHSPDHNTLKPEDNSMVLPLDLFKNRRTDVHSEDAGLATYIKLPTLLVYVILTGIPKTQI